MKATWEIDDDDFDEHWAGLESPFRRRIAGLANRGRSDDDPYVAALVLAYSLRRLHPVETWGVIAVVVIAYLAIAQVFLGGADALDSGLIGCGPDGGLLDPTQSPRGRSDRERARPRNRSATDTARRALGRGP